MKLSHCSLTFYNQMETDEAVVGENDPGTLHIHVNDESPPLVSPSGSVGRGIEWSGRFMRDSNPPSRAPTQPTTPVFELDTPATVIEGEYAPSNTPNEETEPNEELPNSFSNIVPIMIPHKSGRLVRADEKDHQTKMTIHFGILMKPLNKAFEPILPKPILLPSLQRRRSLVFVNTDTPKYLVVDPRIVDMKSKSSDHSVQVRLLMPISELKNHAETIFKDDAWSIVDGRKRMTRLLSLFGHDIETSNKEFLQNEYIACWNSTSVASSCVMEPLQDKTGKLITATNAPNILGRVFVMNWPGGSPIIKEYPPRNAHAPTHLYSHNDI
jgi:hypothetical protein